MKRLILFVFFALLIKGTNAQVKFCPPGAEWHYLFTGSMFSPGNTYNEQIKYIGDSISGADTLKILSHYRFFMYCSPTVNKTVIKQKGDTIFFTNKLTQWNWEILYNFASLPGQYWQTTFYLSINTPTTLTFFVDSVDQINENGFNLKRIKLKSGPYITERLGASSFLFPYIGKISGCDGNGFIENLCYQDYTFGVKQFGEKPCDYFTRNSVGFDISEIESQEIEFYPNPVKDRVFVKLNTKELLRLSINDLHGREIKNFSFNEQNEIDLSEFKKGIYFFQITTNKGHTYHKKIIKE